MIPEHVMNRDTIKRLAEARIGDVVRISHAISDASLERLSPEHAKVFRRDAVWVDRNPHTFTTVFHYEERVDHGTRARLAERLRGTPYGSDREIAAILLGALPQKGGAQQPPAPAPAPAPKPVKRKKPAPRRKR
jgi:hypothetical protein